MSDTFAGGAAASFNKSCKQRSESVLWLGREREINNMDHNMDRLLVLHGELRFGSLSSQLESRNSLTVHLPSGKIKIPPRK
jgi:hypothetical protein